MCVTAIFIALPIKNYLFYALNVFNYAKPPAALQSPPLVALSKCLNYSQFSLWVHSP